MMAANMSRKFPAIVNSATGSASAPFADHEPGRTPRIVARDAVHAHADHLGDEQTLGNIGHEVFWRECAGGEIEITDPPGIAGGFQPQLVGAARVQNPTGQHTILDEGAFCAGLAFAVEGAGAAAADPQRIVDNLDAGREYLSAQTILQERLCRGRWMRR